MSSSKGKPAYVDEVDERTGRVVRENRQVASTKQKPKVHRDSRDSRESRKARRSLSDTAYPAEGSSRDAPPLDERKEVRIERRKSTSSGSSKSPRKTRPPSAHENKSFPKASIPTSRRENMDPSNYGVATPTAAPVMTQPIPLRPRAVSTTQSYARPVSYHAPLPGGGYSRPPLSMSAYYQQPQMPTPSYPPPTPSYMDNFRYAAAPQTEYFQQPQARPLLARFEPRMDPIVRTPSAFEPISRTGSAFEPISRTSSAFGTRSAYEAPGSYFDDNYASASEGATIRRSEKRDSIRVPSNGLTKAQADYAAMPPPTIIRPSILRRSTEYPRAPTEYTLEPDPYRDGRTQYRRESTSRPRRSSSTRHSVSYDLPRGDESVRVEAANSGRRRSGYYAEPPLSTPLPAYEDKLHKAATYQEDVGGPTVPLTAETLKRQQRRHGGSSRSSQSRDESDYKKSATTRTTRSLSNNENDENVTIKVTGQARVMVGGAQIHCDEGGEIEIKRQNNRLPNGSERSNSEYGGGGGGRGGGGGGERRIEDRRSRVERPTLGRSSRSSQSGHSYTRSTPHYPGENFI